MRLTQNGTSPTMVGVGDVHTQLHALAVLSPPTPFGSGDLSSILVGVDAAVVVFVTARMPTHAGAQMLIAAARGRYKFALIVVDLGFDENEGDLADLIALFAAETLGSATLFVAERADPELLADALAAHTIAESTALVLSQCALLLSPTTAIDVEVRRALVPPLEVARALVCRCHNAAVAVHAGAAFCTRTAQLDRYDVRESVSVGSATFAADGALAPSVAAAGEPIRGPLEACAIVDLNTLRLGGAVPLLVVPSVSANTADFGAALTEANKNAALFAALRCELGADGGRCLVVRAAGGVLYALAAMRDGGISLHTYLPASALASHTANLGAPVSAQQAAAVAGALRTLAARPAIDNDDEAFARWRHADALAALMQASGAIVGQTPAPAVAVQAPPAAAPAPTLPKKRRFRVQP